MRKRALKTSMIERMNTSIAAHVAGREDSHGFSELDRFLGEIESLDDKHNTAVEQALLALLPKLRTGHSQTWEAIRMIVDAAKLQSAKVSSAIIKILDEFDNPDEPAARHQAFLAYKMAGGTLTRPRLDKETRLHDEMRPRWVDLTMSAYYGAPESIISLLETEVADKDLSFTWQDVRRRLPLIFRLLGPDFNREIIRVIRAFPTIEGKTAVAKAVASSFKIDPLSEASAASKTEEAHGYSPDTYNKNSDKLDRGKRKMQQAFDRVVQATLQDWRPLLSNGQMEFGP